MQVCSGSSLPNDLLEYPAIQSNQYQPDPSRNWIGLVARHGSKASWQSHTPSNAPFAFACILNTICPANESSSLRIQTTDQNPADVEMTGGDLSVSFDLGVVNEITLQFVHTVWCPSTFFTLGLVQHWMFRSTQRSRIVFCFPAQIR